MQSRIALGNAYEPGKRAMRLAPEHPGEQWRLFLAVQSRSEAGDAPSNWREGGADRTHRPARAGTSCETIFEVR